MAAPIFSDVTALVRRLVDDVDQGSGFVFTDASLYEFGSSIERKIFRRLRIKGVGEANSFITRTVTPSDTKISYDLPAGQELPDDFVKPLVLWEKKSGDPDNTYQEMSNRSERLPDEDSAETIRYWMWVDDTATGKVHPMIQFIAPTTTRTVRIQYQKTIYPVIAASSYVLRVYDSIDAMAAGIVALCCSARGETTRAREWWGNFAAELDELERNSIKGEQRRPRQRRSYRYMQALNS